MPVVWREELSVGNDAIDHDHKYLIRLFNSIELAPASPGGIRHLPLFFDQLLEYTREHSAREEDIQLRYRYPGYVEHKVAHQQILESLEQVNEELNDLLVRAGGGRELDARLLERLDKDVLGLARQWIIDHLVKTDRQPGTFLKGAST
jgi:hemerythrin